VSDLNPAMEPQAPDFPQENDAGQETQDRTDWKAEAIRAQAQLEMLRQPAAPAAAPPPPSPVDAVVREIEQLRANMPQLNPSDPNSFWEREQHKEKLDAARERLMEVRDQERRQQLMRYEYEQKATTAVANVKQQFRSNPGYSAKAEADFDRMLAQVAPHVRADPNALTVMMKNILFDEMARTGNAPRPPAAPGSGYAPGRQGQPAARKGPVQFQSEQEAQVAAYYGMTAEQYYDPKYNERSAEAQGNGTSFYPFPIGGRR
jgi:hypothetical protein